MTQRHDGPEANRSYRLALGGKEQRADGSYPALPWALVVWVQNPGAASGVPDRIGDACLPPVGQPPTWPSSFRPTFDRTIFQGRIDELPAIDIHSL